MNLSALVFKILFLGDSLTAGYLLNAESAFPALVERELQSEGRSVQVINGGVSGDTSAAGLRRLDWMLKSHPDLVVVELGANDMLRGLPLSQLEENLRKILKRLQDRGIDFALIGIKASPTLGKDYEKKFNSIYSKLAKEFRIPLMENLLEGVQGKADLNLYDGIHPNVDGHKMIAERVLKFIRPLIPRAGGLK